MLYWIRHKEHTDILTEGYVGVSSEVDVRFKTHKYLLKNKKHENIHLQRAFDLYGEDQIVFDVIGEFSDDYYIEESVRPDVAIGWNINKGGAKPPISKKGHKKTFTPQSLQTKKERAKRSKLVLTYNGSEEQKKMLSEKLSGRDVYWGDKISMANKANPFPRGNPMRSEESRKKLSESKIGTKTLIKNSKRKMAKPNSEKWNLLISEGWTPK